MPAASQAGPTSSANPHSQRAHRWAHQVGPPAGSNLVVLKVHPPPPPHPRTTGGAAAHSWETWTRGYSPLKRVRAHTPPTSLLTCGRQGGIPLCAAGRPWSTDGAGRAPQCESGRAYAPASLEDDPGGASSGRAQGTRVPPWPRTPAYPQPLKHAAVRCRPPHASLCPPAVTAQRAPPLPGRGPALARRTQLAQSHPSGQGFRPRDPWSRPVLGPGGPGDPRKGKAAAPGRQDGRRRAVTAPKPHSQPPDMARGGSQNWSSGESDGQPEERVAEETG